MFAWYLLKVMLVSSILFGYYLLVLRNKKFHSYNRFYLLATIALSWIIPLIKINFWEETENALPVVKLLAVVGDGNRILQDVAGKNAFTWNIESGCSLAFVSVSIIFLINLLKQIVQIRLLISKNRKEKWNDVYVVFTDAKGTPFSFFKYIFWNDHIDLNTSEGAHVFKHELAHVYEKHSFDKLLLNLALIVGWYNPFLWFIRQELNLIHEFIADQKAIKQGDSTAFASMLLKAAYPTYSFPLSNQFYYSPIKRRLLMLNSSAKTTFGYTRRVAVLPLLLITTILFAFTIKKAKVHLKTSEASLIQKKEKADHFIESSQGQDTIKKSRIKIAIANIDKNSNADVKDSTRKPSISNVIISAKESDSNKLKNPIVILDGKQMSWEEFGKHEVKPDQIQSINVLKDESSIKQFGEKGKNGTIEITTKHDGYVKVAQPSYARVFTVVENPPYYPGGMSKFAEYINGNTQFPKEALQNKDHGAVLIQFIVNEEGKLTDFKKLSSKGHGLEEEAIRLLQNSGDWKPGVQNGHVVPVQVQQQVIFEFPKKP
jgi:TonB family protein